MPKRTENENAGGEVESLALDARDLSALSPEALNRLRSEFGATVELRASKPGMAALLDNLSGRISAGAGAVAEYDRGFDRTNPGYDKYYDRDRALLDPAAAVSNPALDVSVLNRLIRK